MTDIDAEGPAGDAACGPVRESIQPVYPSCFACGRTYSSGDGRFCSTNCRSAYDAGYPAIRSQTAPWRILDGKRFRVWGPIQTDQDLHLATLHFKPKGDGVEIECRGCRQLFISKGLRCCSFGCERKLAERRAIEATMAEVGMERSVKRKCVVCGTDIPRYVGTGKARRSVPISRVTCTGKCQRKRRMALGTKADDLSDEAA